MTYDDWTIGGLKPSIVIKPSYDLEGKKITIQCAASIDTLNGEDPETEIMAFKAIACQNITNTTLQNGGSLIQVGTGDKIEVTDGNMTWTGALHMPVWSPDMYSDYGLEYQLIIDIELQAGEGSFIYTPNYGKYSNIEYYEFTDKTNPYDDPNQGAGNEIGYIKITEPNNITRVEIYGSGCILPCWIECNGERKNWNVSSEKWPGQELQQGWESQEWIFTEPTKTIILETSTHEGEEGKAPGAYTQEIYNHGCYLQYIRVFYE
jgi:hypothetical protein